MPKPKYKLPADNKSRSHPLYWLLAIALACLLAWMWWRSGETARIKPRTTPAKITPDELTLHPAPKPSSAVPQPVPKNISAAATNPVASVIASNRPPAEAIAPGTYPRPVRNVFEAQVALVRLGISSGSIDGQLGSQTRSAILAFQGIKHLPLTAKLDDLTRTNLILDQPALTIYTVTSNDLARLQPLATNWLGKSQQTALDFETILELVSEQSFAHPNYIVRLNPAINWTNVVPGTEVTVPNAAYPEPTAKAAWVTIHLGAKVLEAFDANTNLLVHFPCSIARRVEKRPVGELHVEVVAPNPNYTFDPDVFPESEEAKKLNRKLILPPGPNNPVGVVWIGLDKPGYGIHGTPKPEDVGRTESHGCFRLANWNARHLLKLVSIGTTVYVME
jgi:lipoprotein-anchoring transpeptidase ErfK/SrfK